MLVVVQVEEEDVIVVVAVFTSPGCAPLMALATPVALAVVTATAIALCRLCGRVPGTATNVNLLKMRRYLVLIGYNGTNVFVCVLHDCMRADFSCQSVLHHRCGGDTQ